MHHNLHLDKIEKIGLDQYFTFHSTRDGLPVFSASKRLLIPRRNEKIWKIGVSLCSGCKVGCRYCFTQFHPKFRPLTEKEILEQVDAVMKNRKKSVADFMETKISFKQMGDPLLNPRHTINAIKHLHEQFPDIHYIVSTSGVKLNRRFFSELRKLCDQGANIRLQFSCHTTSDKQRAWLSPNLPMMTFAEIANIANSWPNEAVTLNFVLFKGMEYDLNKVKKIFNIKKVFIKINYLDHFSREHDGIFTKQGLVEPTDDQVLTFVNALKKNSFAHDFRHGHYLQH